MLQITTGEASVNIRGVLYPKNTLSAKWENGSLQVRRTENGECIVGYLLPESVSIDGTPATESNWQELCAGFFNQGSGGDGGGISEPANVDELLELLPPLQGEAPAIILSRDTVGITEGSNSAVQVHLQAQPEDSVTVVISNDNPAAVTASPQTLTFTPQNYASPQAVTLTAVAAGNAALAFAAAGGGYDGVQAALAVHILTAGEEINPFENMTPAAVADFAPSKFLENISIDGNGTVQRDLAAGAQYSALLAAAGANDTAAMEYTVNGSENMWFVFGLNAAGDWYGFGDSGYGDRLLQSAMYFENVNGMNHTSVDGDIIITRKDPFVYATGGRIRAMRQGDICRVWEEVSGEWILRFEADMSMGAEAATYTTKCVGLLQGGSYHLAENVLIYK